jgi:uncharacterized protein YkwD
MKCQSRLSLMFSLMSLSFTLAACGGGDSDTTGLASSIETVAASDENTAAAVPSSTSCGLPNFQQDVLNSINAARAASRSCGSTPYPAAPPLAWNAKLFNAAAGHAQDMAANQYFSHTSQDGRSFSQRISDAGYNWSAAGENIARSQTSVAQVMDGWLNSPDHCRNIMSARYIYVGVACITGGGSQNHWVMDIARGR